MTSIMLGGLPIMPLVGMISQFVIAIPIVIVTVVVIHWSGVVLPRPITIFLGLVPIV